MRRPGALRPAFLRSVLAADLADELLEAREMLLDEVDGRLILQLELVVELGIGAANEDFRPREGDRLEEHHHLAPLVLDAPAAKRPEARRLDRHGLVLERLVLDTRDPVDGVLQTTRKSV